MAAAGPTKTRGTDEEIRIGWQMAGLGFEVAGTALGGAALGWIADRLLGSEPRGLMIGSIAGIAVGLLTLIRRSLQLNRRLDEIARRRRPGAGPPPAPPPAEDEVDDWDERWERKWSDGDGEGA